MQMWFDSILERSTASHLLVELDALVYDIFVAALEAHVHPTATFNEIGEPR